MDNYQDTDRRTAASFGDPPPTPRESLAERWVRERAEDEQPGAIGDDSEDLGNLDTEESEDEGD